MNRDERLADDLVDRCRELLEWSSTGLLNGGKGGAVRALADRIREKVGETYALSLAESQTKDEAMREVVRLAALQPDGENAINSQAGNNGTAKAVMRAISEATDCQCLVNGECSHEDDCFCEIAAYAAVAALTPASSPPRNADMRDIARHLYERGLSPELAGEVAESLLGRFKISVMDALPRDESGDAA